MLNMVYKYTQIKEGNTITESEMDVENMKFTLPISDKYVIATKNSICIKRMQEFNKCNEFTN